MSLEDIENILRAMADPVLSILPLSDEQVSQLPRRALLEYALSLRDRNQELIKEKNNLKAANRWYKDDDVISARYEDFIKDILGIHDFPGSPHFSSALTGIADGSYKTLADMQEAYTQT